MIKACISVCVRARFVKQGSADNSMSMATVEENANRREDPEAADSDQSTTAAGGRGPGPAKATPAPRLDLRLSHLGNPPLSHVSGIFQ